MHYLRHLLVSKGVRTAWRRGWAIATQLGPTEARMARTLAAYVDLLARFDVRPTFPTPAMVVERHPQVLARLYERGAEIAVHGDLHVDMTALSPAEQRAHVERAVHRFQRWGIPARGFRAPYLRWNASLLETLRTLGVYDSSLAVYWDVLPPLQTTAYERLQRVLTFYRAQPAPHWPLYPVWEQGVLRLPVSLPDDEILVDRLQWREAAAFARVWGEMLSTTHERGGLLVLQLHPERFWHCADALARVLEQATGLQPPVWVAPMETVAAWWQRREQARVQLYPVEQGWRAVVEGVPDPGWLVNTRTVEPGEPWGDRWTFVRGDSITILGEQRPTVGVTEQVPVTAVRALQAAGYVVESVRDHPAVVIDVVDWSLDTQARVWQQLAQASAPLIRLNPWPGATRCALCVTGDLDAVTWWDFLRRVGYSRTQGKHR